VDEAELAEKLLREHVTTVAALIQLQLRRLSEFARTRVLDAIRDETGVLELRTRIAGPSTELVLVPTDGSEPLWLTRTGE
jgi:hypothetical protein